MWYVCSVHEYGGVGAGCTDKWWTLYPICYQEDPALILYDY